MSAPVLVHLATMNAQLGSDPFVIPNGPKGTRVVGEVESVTISGERFNATMVGQAAADWLTIAPDGTYGTLDVRVTLKTHDDVLVYCEYSGRIDLVTGRVVSTPLFQTGDERYDWLNRIQFIGDGTLDQETQKLVYELYEVRLS